jgi:hypothetical protein
MDGAAVIVAAVGRWWGRGSAGYSAQASADCTGPQAVAANTNPAPITLATVA